MGLQIDKIGGIWLKKLESGKNSMPNILPLPLILFIVFSTVSVFSLHSHFIDKNFVWVKNAMNGILEYYQRANLFEWLSCAFGGIVSK